MRPSFKIKTNHQQNQREVEKSTRVTSNFLKQEVTQCITRWAPDIRTDWTCASLFSVLTPSRPLMLTVCTSRWQMTHDALMQQMFARLLFGHIEPSSVGGLFLTASVQRAAQPDKSGAVWRANAADAHRSDWRCVHTPSLPNSLVSGWNISTRLQDEFLLM